jgi:hypothetical protein
LLCIENQDQAAAAQEDLHSARKKSLGSKALKAFALVDSSGSSAAAAIADQKMV